MITTTNTLEVIAAQRLLSQAITTLAHRTIAETRVRYLPASDAPNTWEQLQAVDLSKGVLPIWNGASERSVYGSPQVNYLFRYWHDMGHLQFGLSFTPEDERSLQLDHHLLQVVDTLPVQRSTDLAIAMYHADTVGQIDYIVANGRFPDDQLSFVLAYIEDPHRAVATPF